MLSKIQFVGGILRLLIHSPVAWDHATRLFTTPRMRSLIWLKWSMDSTLSIISGMQYVTDLFFFSLHYFFNLIDPHINKKISSSSICLDIWSMMVLFLMSLQELLHFFAVGGAVWWVHGWGKMAGNRWGSYCRGLPEKWCCHVRSATYICTHIRHARVWQK